MDFDTIRARVGHYETAPSSVVAAQLQSLIAKRGLDVFRDGESLIEAVFDLDLPKVAKAQLALVLTASNLPDFLLNTRSELQMVDVDNAIHDVLATTGLSYQCALRLVTDILYACGLSFAVEMGPVLAGSAVEQRLHALMPSEAAAAELRAVEALIDECSPGKKGNSPGGTTSRESLGDAVQGIQRLCHAGIPKGFYLLGRCHLYGELGTAKDIAFGKELMRLASAQGVTQASAALGDAYYQARTFWGRDYTLAHHYYTRPGAMAMGEDRQKALQDIYRQYALNKSTLVHSGLLLILTLAFVLTFNEGVFSGSGRFVFGVASSVISGIALATGIFFLKVKRYNGLRGIVAVQYLAWALYALVLVLA